MLWTGYQDSRDWLRHGILALAMSAALLHAEFLSTLDLEELSGMLLTA